MKWLDAANKSIRQATQQLLPHIPTRLFVRLFIEPLVACQASVNNDKDQETTAVPVPLYFYVPPEYRYFSWMGFMVASFVQFPAGIDAQGTV